MSKFNKKKKQFEENNQNKYKLEELGPRIMMDASADDWNQEALLLDVNAASIFVSSSDYQKWANTDIRTLFVEDSSKGEVRVAKAADLIDENQAASLLSLNASDIASLKQVMSSASQIAKSSYRQSLLNTAPFNGINDPNTSAEEKQSLINSLDSAVTQHKFSAAEMAVYLNALASSSGYVFGVDTESDSLVVSIVKHEMATNPNIAANVTGFANVATNLQGVNVDGGHNVDRNASFSVKLDGASNPEYINQTISVAAHFRQYTQQDVDDESDSERKAELEAFLQANGSVLEYKSIADVDESVPDYSVGLGLSAAGVNEIFKADLDFDVVESSRISGLVSSTGVKLVCDENTHVWSWVGAADVESIEQATMGLILHKLSDLSAWLNRNSTVTPDNPVPLLYDSFAGVLSQNATEYAKLPSLLNNLLNKPPKSLQELHEIMKNDVATPVELNGDELLLSFKLSVSNENPQNVSIAVDELSRLGFTVTRNESLALRTSAILEFTLSIDLTAQMRADGTTFLKDIVAEENILDFFGRQSVAVDNGFGLKVSEAPAYSDIRSGICLYKNVTIEAGYVGGFSLAMPDSFNKEFELKWNDLNDAIKFYAADVEELVSAIQATFTENGVNIHTYNAGSEIFLVKGDECNVASVKLDSTDFTSCYVKVVENTPIDVKGGDIVLTFDGNVETITIGASDNLDRGTVISQINEKLAGIDDGIFSASFKDGLFAIECKDNMSFDVSGTFFSNNNLFTLGTSLKSSSANCLKITIENKITGIQDSSYVDLASWYNVLPKTEQDSLRLNAIIAKICEICQNKIMFDGSRLVGADGYNLVSVEVVGGTLGSILGLAGKADEGARFELDALLLSALDDVKYKNFDLVLENKLTGDVDIDARVGMLGEHFSANGVNMGHQLELKYDDTKGLAQLPDTDVLAIHQSIATLAADFENAYNILTACLDKVFNGTALTTTNISSYVELLSSIDGFVNTIKSLGNRIENVWNYVNQEYGSIVSEFEDQKIGLLEDIEDIISYIPDCGQDFLTLFKDCDFAKIVSVIQELNNARNDINGIFPTTAADYVQSIKTLFSGISSSIETYLGVSNWRVTKTPLLGTTNSITINSEGTDNFNLGSFEIVNNVAAVNDTVQGLISGASITTALNWDTTGLSEDALEVWSGVELGGAMKMAASNFGEKLLGVWPDGSSVDGFESIFDTDILTSEIPFIGKSIADLCGFNVKLEEFRRILASVNGLTMQDFAAQLLDRIGMSVSNLKVLQVAEGVEQKHRIQMDFVWKYEVKNGKFVLNDIGSNEVHIGGALDVNLNVSFAFQISMVLEYDPTVDGKVKVNFIPVEINGTAQKLIEASASIEKNPLAGDLHLYIGDLQAPLVEIVEGSNILLKFSCGVNLNENESVLGLSVDNANVNAQGKINLSVLGQKAGYIEIGCGENGTGLVDLTDSISKLIPSVGILSNPVDKTGLWVDATQVNVDFNVTSLFEQVRLVSDGLSQVLRRAISGVNKEVLRDSVRNIPFIGDRIVGVADSLTKLDESFIEPFRNFVNKAQNLNAEMVAFKLYNLLKGANILGELEDCSGSTDAQSEQYTWADKIFNKFYNNIQYYESAEEAYWHVRICGNYDLDPNADFDLGFPGLGLRSEGGLKISLTWSLDIGFGISENDGAFLLLADGNDFEVKLNVNTKDGFKVDGSLGFMKMSLRDNTSVDNSKAFGDRNGFVVNLDVDLNNQKDKLVNVHNIGSGISVKAEIDAELKKTWELALSAGRMFPELDVDLYIDWSAKTGTASNGLKELSFKNVKFKGGTFIDKTVAPVLENIRKVIEPIQPLIKFLQSEIPVLNKLPAGKVHITVLDLIKMYGSKNDMDFGFIDDIVQLNNLVQIFGNVTHEGLVVKLPDFVLWKNAEDTWSAGDIAKRNDVNAMSLDFLSGASKNIDAYVQQLRETFTLGRKTIEIDGLKEFADALKDFKIPEFDAGSGAMESTSLSMNGGRGWAFPILENPLTEIGGLLFGRDATLVTYNMSPLKFNFDWKNSYPIVGPLCADIGFNFGVCIDLTFGYDTHGLSRWKDSDYKNIGLLLDGFYIADWNENGKDTAEVIFHSGVVAGASVAGRAGINVGLNFDVNLDFNDPNNDGKLRMGELANMWQTNPIYIFDASATIDAEAYAYLDYFFGRKKWTLWSSGAFELFDTASKSGKSDNPVLVSDNGDYLVVNVGEYASNRVHESLADGNDDVTITFTGARKGTVSWNNSEAYDFDLDKEPDKPLKGICVYAGQGKDNITITSGVLEIEADVIVYGGDGDDVINASSLKLAEGFNAMLVGGIGIDRITGAVGSGNNFIFGETGRYVMDKNKKNVLLAETLPADGDVSGNVLTGGSGKNFVFGGEGADIIYAGTGLNYLFGDRGRIEISAADLPVASRYDLFDEGEDDLIYGSDGDDHIYGGAGNDWIEGFAGNDEIFAGQGNDIVFGGNGIDTIHGGDGDDLIFGDTPFKSNMVIASENNSEGILPYVYVSKEFKKVSHPLFDSNGEIALRTPEEHYISTLSQYGATLKSSSGMLSNSTDFIYGENGSDVIFGDDGKNNVDLLENEVLSGGNDVIDGGADNDFIDGDAGDDRIMGGSGEDILYGGQGNDTLEGGAGNDIVFGDDGWAGYNAGALSASANWFGTEGLNNKLVFGETVKSFLDNFKIDFNALAETVGGNDSIIAGNGSDIVDGQSGDDLYEINFMGSYNRAYTNIIESGVDINDVLTVNGTLEADDVLVRRSEPNEINASTNAKLGFVALLPDEEELSPTDNPKAEKSQIERINFWNVRNNGGVEKLNLNTGAGKDNITIDGTLTAIAVDAGAGNDTINVGQFFQTGRLPNEENNIQQLDGFATTLTTQGYLSNGVEHSTSIYGGSGDDTFNMLHTSAAISLSGGTGDDTFNVATFQKADAEGNPDGIVQNAPVTLLGGAGNDTMSVAGTEADDTFVISEGSIQSSGVNLQAVSIENQNAYGGAGDDEFYVLDTLENSVVYLNGNEGNDSFYNGGSQSDLPYIMVDNIDYKGHSGIISHTVESNTDKYRQKKTDSIAVNIRDNDIYAAETRTVVDILFTDEQGNLVSEPHAAIREGNGVTTVYGIKLSRAPAQGEEIAITVYAPEMPNDSFAKAERGVFLVDTDGGLASSVTLRFNSTNYNCAQFVRLIALSDNIREGDDHIALLHGVACEPTTKVNPCRNVILFLEDDRKTERFDESGNSIDLNRNAFTETLTRTISQDEADNKSFTIGLHSSAVVEDFYVWYEGMPDDIEFEYHMAQNALTVRWVNNAIPAGTTLFVNYTALSMQLDNTSYVNLKYETDNLGYLVLGTDYSTTTLNPYTNDSVDGFSYRLNDGNSELTLNAWDSSKPGFVLCWIKECLDYNEETNSLELKSNIYGVSELQIQLSDHVTSYDLTYEESYNHSHYFKQIDNTIKIFDENNLDVTSQFDGATLLYRAAYWVGGTDGKITPENAVFFVDENRSVDFLVGEDHVISSNRVADGKGGYSEEGYFYRIEGSQVIICSNKTGLPVTVSGCLSVAQRKQINVTDEKYAWESLSAANFSELGSKENPDSTCGKVVISQTNGSTDVEEGGGVDTYAISLDGEDLVGAETVKVTINTVLTPYYREGDKQSPENLRYTKQIEIRRIVYIEENAESEIFSITNTTTGNTAFDEIYVEFSKDRCKGYFLVTVGAIDDNVAESDNPTLVPIGERTIENILGEVLEDGAGYKPESIGESVSMLRYVIPSNEHPDDAAEKDVKTIEGDSSTSEEDSFDETRCVDRIFVNNMDNPYDAQSSTKALIDSKTDSASVSNPKVILSEDALLASDSESIHFEHTDQKHINTSEDVKKNIAFGNMEYGEINLGTGADTVDIYKSIYREDGFQTFTVMNSGEGGDTINVHSYQDGEDDQLVINAGEGNDTVAATGANVTKDGLIVFGGLGDDSIDIDSDSSFVFGDRGQVLYHDDNGNVVTRLGDDGSGVTVKGEGNTYTPSENGSDYATGKNKDSEAYWQTDGVRRGPSIARTVTENQGGNDVITLADGRNVVFGGVNATRTVPADTSKHENENEVISTGNGNDLVFGDDGYATFGGHAALAETLELDNAPETRTEATLSFNFMGASQTGLSSEDVAGAADFAKSHWNNVGGSLAGTYGNDDRETVRFDDGTRASAVSVSYGGIESHRNTSTDNRINLQAYGHNFANASTDADAALMNSGYMTTAPSNQCDNRLEVAVDGLAQYFTDYRVAVYLDMPDANSWEGQSIRKVSLYVGDSTVALQSFYVNDCAGSNFNGSYKRSEYTSAEDILADLAHNAAVLSGELTGEDAVLIDTTGNYVVFEVPAGVAADNFRVIIEDGYTLDNINGKDIPGIAAIQVKGSLHAQDVAASTDIAHGGADTVYTSGGDDIVVGGTGGDTLMTYGDERYGIYDNDVVFGDNAKMVFTDRDSSEATASTLSLAESLDSRTVAGDYNDHIYTGDGNDVVVGGQGADHIESGATAAAEAMLDGIQVASFNFTRENATASEMVGETAGVVADNDWTNLYIKNNGLHIVGENYTNDPVTHDGIGISLVAYDTAVGNGTQNSSLMPKDDAQLDGDTSNSKLFNAYYAAQQQQEIKLTLTNLDSFADGAPCDVYVYLGGDQQNTDTYNYLFDVWGHQVGGATPDQHYYLNDWTGSHFDGDYRRVKRETAPTAAELLSQVAPDMSLVGNYVVFRGVSSSTFEVRIRNLFTDTNQWPLNLPVITAVQVVAGENREEDIAVGGDHDKDLVFGDDARVTFDIDTPFARNENLADYANRAIEAESMHFDGAAVEIPLDENDEPVEMGDTILTGKDRDVIVGGDFGDTITMGDGDDVALGDNASLILEYNNPVGVFAPSVEIMLEQHTVTTSTPEVFLGNNDADADDIQDKFENGGVPGVTPETSENGATDTFTDTTDKDWTIQQEVTPGTISQTIDISSGAQVITFAEGETVLLVSDTWPGNQWWHPNIVMVADGQGHSVPALEWEWDVNGTTMTATTQPGYYFTVDIPDTPNGDNRYEIRVTALAAGTVVISIGA
jgi:Ca2+-binding RTX toxin-like protein